MSWFNKKEKPLDTTVKANSITKDLNGLYVVQSIINDKDYYTMLDATLVMDKDSQFVWRYNCNGLEEGDQKYFDSLETAVKSAYLEAAQRALERINKQTVAATEVNV